VIDKLPKCLHTCLHCRHAAISEEYVAYSRKLMYNGCWKFDNFKLPVGREDCEKFAESEERTSRNFWEKWDWKVYVDGDLVTLEQPEPGAEKNYKQTSQGHDESYATAQRPDKCCEKSIEETSEQPKKCNISPQNITYFEGEPPQNQPEHKQDRTHRRSDEQKHDQSQEQPNKQDYPNTLVRPNIRKPDQKWNNPTTGHECCTL
jgi:hypothetical protein